MSIASPAKAPAKSPVVRTLQVLPDTHSGGLVLAVDAVFPGSSAMPPEIAAVIKHMQDLDADIINAQANCDERKRADHMERQATELFNRLQIAKEKTLGLNRQRDSALMNGHPTGTIATELQAARQAEFYLNEEWQIAQNHARATREQADKKQKELWLTMRQAKFAELSAKLANLLPALADKLRAQCGEAVTLLALRARLKEQLS